MIGQLAKKMNLNYKNIGFLCFISCQSVISTAQIFEVDGTIKINTLTLDEESTEIVVLRGDSTLGKVNKSVLIEYQALSRIEDTIFLDNGGFVVLPPDEVDDADADPINEIQELSSNGDTLFLSQSNFIVLPGLQYLSSLVPEIPIQERLDNGESPLSIYQSGTPTDSLYGKTYQGGYIFYLDHNDNIPMVEGMVASFSDIEFFGSFYWIWGCSADEPLPIITNFPPSGSSADIGDGQDNTSTIDNHNCSSVNIAAVKCADASIESFNDWFLPSVNELELMWENLADVDMNDSNSGPNDIGNIGGFTNTTYWSSTPGDDGGAWQIDFSNGSQSVQLRTTGNRVRPVRIF